MNSWVCTDASLVVRLLAGPGTAVVQQHWDTWLAAGQQIAAPLLRYEVANALYRDERAGMPRAASVDLALQAVLALPIQYETEPTLHQRALAFALRLVLPAAYDAHYLAVAELHGAELWTTDGRLARACQPHLPWVRLLTIVMPCAVLTG